MPPEYIALEARLEAWLNLSHRENAKVFVMVRMSAITGITRQVIVFDALCTKAWKMPFPKTGYGLTGKPTD